VVRLAICSAPNSARHCATLCAVTWATPPAPMMRTLGFVTSTVSLSRGQGKGAGQAVAIVVVAELPDRGDGTIQFADADRRHGHAVEPVLLDHGIAGGVGHGNAVADLQRLRKARLAEDVAGKAGLPGDLIGV